jgi:hypothetical protein
VTTCKSCGADIVFVKTQHGKTTPLDAIPNPAGNIVLVGGVATVAKPGQHAEMTRYMPHWSTCVAAAQHRKAR